MVNINRSKTQLSKIMQSGRFLGTLLGPLQVGLLLMRNVLMLFIKSVVTGLGLIAAADAGIHKKFWHKIAEVLFCFRNSINNIKQKNEINHQDI